MCGRGGVWEGWRCVGSSEVCGRGGGVWEGWKSVVGGVEVCGRGKVCGGMDGVSVGGV